MEVDSFMELGATLKKYRNDCGLTQDEAADKLGVTRQAISSWERGITVPDIEMIGKISRLYNVKLEKLLNEEDPADQPQKEISIENKYPVERKYIGYFIVVAFLAIACMFPIFGIAACLFAFYLCLKFKMGKSAILIIFFIIALIFSVWNTWNFINVNFIQNGSATIDMVAELKKCILFI